MKNLTNIFILSMIVIISVFDVYTLSCGGTENTISHKLVVLSYQYPIIPFIFGILAGHIFWRMSDTKETAKISEDTK